MKIGQPTEIEELKAQKFIAENSRGAVYSPEELKVQIERMSNITTRGYLPPKSDTTSFGSR